ncbi:DUF3034 family protein [Sphaerotilus sp.]|uniref:DUF3034 family protein n=1 Tax=Sphaerotilus sp. TaxID=2093942 RepID=UPI00286E3D59|nr:DUF3034 family protein [Sphaerotilus sp.]
MRTTSPSIALRSLYVRLVLLALLSCAGLVRAGDRLTATAGVGAVEGSGGGGLVPWALIGGYGSRDQVGATAHLTRVRTDGGYTLTTTAAAIGVHDTWEASLAQMRFGLGDTVPGQSVKLNVLGLKWRVLGDAVYDQDRWWPQLSVGAQFKHNEDMAVPTALGARHASGTDLYASATKIWLGGLAGHNALANLTLRSTRANQFGLLGFGGDVRDQAQWVPEFSGAVLLRDDLAVGVEWRRKPDNLSVFREDSAHDVFVAWWPVRNLSLTAAAVHLGNIANKASQRGWYVSAQAIY